MPKFRYLTKDELQELEKEFIEYLIVNGITSSGWERLKKEENERAEEILKLFSDVVLERVLRNVVYLEHRTKTEVKTFHCLGDKLVLVAMKVDDQKTEVDFMDESFINKAAIDPPESLQIYTTNKQYSKNRELELFEMTQAGCEISDGKLFKMLCLALPESFKAQKKGVV
ncbi:hypothetical protein JYU23_00260 [bacterium AH-315-C07]|nr:hypothetical protein [bacterium AH-315-C07]